jgi:hypothetical protein
LSPWYFVHFVQNRRRVKTHRNRDATPAYQPTADRNAVMNARADFPLDVEAAELDRIRRVEAAPV